MLTRWIYTVLILNSLCAVPTTTLSQFKKMFISFALQINARLLRNTRSRSIGNHSSVCTCVRGNKVISHWSPKSRIPDDTKWIQINFADRFITILSQKGSIFPRLHNPTCHISWWTLGTSCSCITNFLPTEWLQFCSFQEAGNLLDQLKYFNSPSNMKMLLTQGQRHICVQRQEKVVRWTGAISFNYKLNTCFTLKYWDRKSLQ